MKLGSASAGTNHWVFGPLGCGPVWGGLGNKHVELYQMHPGVVPLVHVVLDVYAVHEAGFQG